jgi:hypothetical protein
MGSCTNCGSTDLVHIEMSLRGGPVGFSHCRRCEHRWWSDAEVGHTLPLAAVLGKAAA